MIKYCAKTPGAVSGGSVTLPNEVRSFDPVYIVAGVLLALIVVAFLFLLLGGRRRKKQKGGGETHEEDKTV